MSGGGGATVAGAATICGKDSRFVGDATLVDDLVDETFVAALKEDAATSLPSIAASAPSRISLIAEVVMLMSTAESYLRR